MNDLDRMRFFQSIGDLNSDFNCFLPGQTFSGDFFFQSLSFNVFGRDEIDLIRFFNFVNRDDIGMIESPQDGYLRFEIPDLLRCLLFCFGSDLNDFQCILIIIQFVNATIYFAVCA